MCRKIMTNADKIRAMSDEDLFDMFMSFCNAIPYFCYMCPFNEVDVCAGNTNVLKKWLAAPAESEE